VSATEATPSKPQRTPGARAWRLAFVLLLGAAGAFASAWLPPLWSGFRRTNTTPVNVYADWYRVDGPDGRVYEAAVERGFARAAWMLRPRSSTLARPGERFEDPVYPQAKPPRWLPWPAAGPGEGSSAVAYGWPARCMLYTAAWHHTSGRSRMATEGAWGVRLGTAPFQIAELPLMCLPAGFVINTAVWGAAAGALVLGAPALLRWRRRRRGLCPACGYAVGALGRCPECGATA
jgi:hypothetical protein